MRRIFMFLILGTILEMGAFILTAEMWGKPPHLTDPSEYTIGILACLMISVPCLIFDGALTYVVRPAIRVPWTAVCGSAVVAAILFWLAGSSILQLRIPMVMAAICMGICSWLSSEKQKESVSE